MTRDNVLKLQSRLSALNCYSEDDLRTLMGYANDIEHLIRQLASKKSDDHSGLHQLSGGQLFESKSYLDTWLKHPKKSTMNSTFREYKGDFLSVLRDYIAFGDEHDLWDEAM